MPRTERLTEGLLEHLLASKTVEGFLSEPEVGEHVLADYPHELLNEKGLTVAEACQAAGFSNTVPYDWCCVCVGYRSGGASPLRSL